MRILKKNIDILVVVVALLLFGIYPISRFLFSFLEHISINGYDFRMTHIEMWFYMLVIIDGVEILTLFSPIIIMVFSTYRFHLYSRNGYILQELQRKKYSSLMRNKVLFAWTKSVFLYFGYYLVVFLAIFLFPTKESYLDSMYFPIQHPTQLFLYIMVNIMFFSLFVTNLGLIVIRYSKKYIISTVLTMVLFISITLVFYAIGLFVGNLIDNVQVVNTIYLYNLMVLDSVVSYEATLIFSILLFLSSSIVLFLVYRNEEKVVMTFEN